MALRGEESNFVSCGRSRRVRAALILRLEPEDLRVAFHVHEAVAAHVEGDDLGLAGFFALQRFVNRTGDAVRALRSRQESLGLDELTASFEDVPFVLRIRDRVDVPEMPQQGEDGGAGP